MGFVGVFYKMKTIPSLFLSVYMPLTFLTTAEAGLPPNLSLLLFIKLVELLPGYGAKMHLMWQRKKFL